jgi:hypothetical protein
MREFLISMASGIVVAVISNLFIGRRGEKSGTSLSQSMSSNSGSSSGKIFIAFLLGAAIVFAVLMFHNGRFSLPHR